MHPGPPPKFVIGEAKYDKARLNKKALNNGTRQMDKEWIENSLENDLGGDKGMANKILKNYDSVLVNVAPDGSITKYYLDDNANIIK